MPPWLYLCLDRVDQRVLRRQHRLEKLSNYSVLHRHWLHDAFFLIHILGLGRHSPYCRRPCSLLPSEECHSNYFLDGKTEGLFVELPWNPLTDCAIFRYKRLLLFRSRWIHNCFFIWIPGDEVLQNGGCNHIRGGRCLDRTNFLTNTLHHRFPIWLCLCPLRPSHWWKVVILPRCETARLAKAESIFAPLWSLS